jgi:hypothetical protein
MADDTTKQESFKDKIPPEVWQHMRAAREEIREGIRAIMPPEFREHRRNASREMLLAWRSAIDAALKRMDEKDKASE